MYINGMPVRPSFPGPRMRTGACISFFAEMFCFFGDANWFVISFCLVPITIGLVIDLIKPIEFIVKE